MSSAKAYFKSQNKNWRKTKKTKPKLVYWSSLCKFSNHFRAVNFDFFSCLKPNDIRHNSHLKTVKN